jgi:di/tricarboxylate transporter
MDTLSWQAWATLAVVLAMLVALVRELARTDLILMGAVGVLVALGILTPQEAFAGFSNSAVIAVGSLFVVAAAVQNTGALAFADRLMFPRQPHVTEAAVRMGLTVGTLSAFLNNTPLVAMFMPRVQVWCQRMGVSPSKLLIPLSYATILGGVTTLVGTSTNLVVSGLMEEAGLAPLRLFTQTPIALPASLAGFLALIFVGMRFLPDRKEGAGAQADGLERCLFELRVPPGSSFVGQTVEDAGLRALGDAFLAHVRSGREIVPAAPETVLRAGDTLLFQGSARAMEALLERPGLARAVEPVAEPALATLPLFEAVVSDSSALVGKTLREVAFRETYGGVVLALRRQADEVVESLGRTPIRAGDLLLIEAPLGFAKRWNASREEFYLVASRRAPRPRPQPRKAPFALFVLVAAVAVAAFDVVPIETTAFVGALLLVATRCLSGQEARRAVEIQTLVVIAASLGVGKAIEETGLAAFFAEGIVGGLAALGPVGAVAAIYVATSIVTELITNNAAAALLIPIGIEVAAQTGIAPEVLGVTVAIAASSSFLTPIGYQTNMMVMAAGGYRFTDYWWSGLPLFLVYSTMTVLMIWLLWL